MQENLATRTSSFWAYISVFVGSFIVTAWAVYIDPVINPDGVKYVLAAEYFLRGEYRAGFEAYKWPGFSLAVALVTKLSGLETETAALLFNAIMRGVAGLAFIRLVTMFGASGKTTLFGVLVYVFYPGLNEVQSMIIRDFAYLACFLWMVVHFLEQTWNPTRARLIGFVSMALLATLFRIEGLIFIFGLIVFYLMSGTVSRQFRIFGILAIGVALPVLVYGLLTWIFDGELGNAWGLVVTMFELSKTDLYGQIETIDSPLLNSFLLNLSPVILGLMPFAKLVFNVLEILTIGYAIILVWGLFNRPLVSDGGSRTMLLKKGWLWIVGINLLVLVGYVMIRQIVTDRYPLSLALMLMVYLPFAITAILDKSALTSRQRIYAGILGVLLFINSAEGLDRFTNKMHLKEAGLWIKSQSDREITRRNLYSNNRVVDYYAGRKEVDLDQHYSQRTVTGLTQSDRWKLLHFMTITLKADSPPGFYRNFRYRYGKEPDRIFTNDSGSKVLVYDFRQRQNQSTDNPVLRE